MAYTTIDSPYKFFNVILYSGDSSSTRSISGLDFKPDWVWIKRRNSTAPNNAYDVVRGASKQLVPDDGSAETTNNQYGYVSGFESDGFEVTGGSTNLARVNSSSGTYVAWNWLAANGTTSNSNGNTASTVSANTTAGFSVVTWTGTGSDTTVGHGLSSAPEMYVVKNRSDGSTNWRVGQTVAGNTMTAGNGYYMEWDDTKASTNPGSATTWGSTPTAPTSSVFTVGSNNAHNGSSDNMLAYCFHSVKGFSKIGSYIGNGSAVGTFVYTGFKPAYILMKNNGAGGNSWRIYDNKRDTFNEMDNALFITTAVEGNYNAIDFLSNGFKIRGTSSAINSSGGTYLYYAIAENPFVSEGTKAAGTAK